MDISGLAADDKLATVRRWEAEQAEAERTLRVQLADLTARHSLAVKQLQILRELLAVLSAPQPAEEAQPVDEAQPAGEPQPREGLAGLNGYHAGEGSVPDETAEPFREPDVASLRGMTQLEIMRRIADLNGGIVRINEAKRVVTQAGAATAMGRNLSSSLHHRLKKAPDFKWLEPGVFRRLPQTALPANGLFGEVGEDVEEE